ncbi:S-layer homology domain-containing protein [Paenibacillus sp. LHD-38]|uniref:S-layer homology domain-containing protein n=1 Tax=Paenibacillus sp. LHD-38 TaxID=3072143 RepID=UPI00280DB4CE|nr:S-layer homology domain-containing protein [Paenibacillus sp. LHD-38]MDQ8732969.1 S-layer homology domain-containing protein [Paenibacillus sp. LHD-38]
MMQKIGRVFLALTLLVTMLMGAQAASAAAAFTDMKKHWAKEEISAAVNQGWINGYNAKTFKPNANMTRAEFLKSLVAALKIKAADSDTPFVDDTGWFRAYIATGLKQSIIKVGDYEENNFEPNSVITREEIARMTIRALGKDAEGVKSGYLAVAKKLEIMQGYPDGTMGGDKNATRAEAVVMVMNTLTAKNPPALVVAYPKTKEQLNTLIQSLPSFKGTTTYGRNGIILVNSKGSDNFADNTLVVEYDSNLKATIINVADPTTENQSIVKDLFKTYYPSSFEKAYSAYIKVSKAADSDDSSAVKTKYDNRSFEAYKGINTKRVVIWIGA